MKFPLLSILAFSDSLPVVAVLKTMSVLALPPASPEVIAKVPVAFTKPNPL